MWLLFKELFNSIGKKEVTPPAVVISERKTSNISISAERREELLAPLYDAANQRAHMDHGKVEHAFVAYAAEETDLETFKAVTDKTFQAVAFESPYLFACMLRSIFEYSLSPGQYRIITENYFSHLPLDVKNFLKGVNDIPHLIASRAEHDRGLSASVIKSAEAILGCLAAEYQISLCEKFVVNSEHNPELNYFFSCYLCKLAEENKNYNTELEACSGILYGSNNEEIKNSARHISKQRILAVKDCSSLLSAVGCLNYALELDSEVAGVAAERWGALSKTEGRDKILYLANQAKEKLGFAGGLCQGPFFRAVFRSVLDIADQDRACSHYDPLTVNLLEYMKENGIHAKEVQNVFSKLHPPPKERIALEKLLA